jgi:hypothetical protein
MKEKRESEKSVEQESTKSTNKKQETHKLT